MIDAIYASKLYKASKRKDKIHAALTHKSNAELVTQLKSYLDEEYQDLAEPEPQPAPEPADSVADNMGEGGAPKEGGSSSKGHSAPSSHPSGSFSIPDSFDAGLDEDFNPADNLVTVDDDEIPEVSDTDTAPEPDESVEESENVYGCTDVTERADVIKGTLNGQAETAGVARVHVKDNEMWIYYKDDINLNNIMTAVIEYMNAAGYTDLEFNRLARSDNAIVFVINSVQEDIKPAEPVEAAGKVEPVSPATPSQSSTKKKVPEGDKSFQEDMEHATAKQKEKSAAEEKQKK